MELHANLQSVALYNNVKALCNQYDVLESNLRSLKALGFFANSYRYLLFLMLMNKLFGELQLDNYQQEG